MHDWYSKAGQGVGASIATTSAAAQMAVLAAHLLNQTATQHRGGSAAAASVRGARLRQSDAAGQLRARARADYFSSVAVNQSFNTNVYDASATSATYGANMVGAWRTFSLNGTYDRSEYFTTRQVGHRRKLAARRAVAERTATLRHTRRSTCPRTPSSSTSIARHRARDDVIDDSSLGRFDFSPQVRYPFKRWQFFTVNSSLSWRDTYYTRSYPSIP